MLERLFQLFLGSNLDHNDADSGDDSGCIFDRVAVRNPVTGSRSCGKHGGTLEVDYQFSRGEHASKLGLHYIGEISQDLPYRLAQVVRCWEAVDFRKRVIDCEIAKFRVEDGKANGGRSEMSGEHLL
jgi:hypothetical protein